MSMRVEVDESRMWQVRGGSAPPDVPLCGFSGNDCPIEDSLFLSAPAIALMIAIIVSAFIVLVAIVCR